MFHFMKNMVMTAVMFGIVFAQSPILRVKQIGEWKTPEYWWKAQETVELQKFLAEDVDAPALKNNNFDSWRDDILEMEVTLDDVGEDITAVRFDIAFDNDLITWVENDGTTQETSINAWSQGNSRVIKGSHIADWDEGADADSTTGDYSFEVVHFSNVGYRDSLAVSGNNYEESISDSGYDWLRITMVSHGNDADGDGTPDKTFGGGDGVQKQLLKLKFRINDVDDDYEPRSFRIPTFYNGSQGYYTYVSDDYLLDYKVYIDGNWGNSVTDNRTFNGGARGDITLHPKLVDVEGFGRYIGERTDTDSDGQDDDTFVQKSYPFWKVVFELDESNPDQNSDWYNIENIADDSSVTDEDLSDDVIGDSGTYYYYKLTDQNDPKENGTVWANQALPGNGFLGVSYFDYTYTDQHGYYNIQLPRNNNYRISIWPPDADDDIGEHDNETLDRYAVTNINDAIAAFNFQSNKFVNSGAINIDSPSAYLIGDVDGDDVFQLNDAYFLWAYVSGVFANSYTHVNGETYQQWSGIDNLKANGNAETLNYYQSLRGGDTKQRREFTMFWDDSLAQETAELTKDAGGVAWFNPTLMDAVQTGQDTLNISIGAGISTFDDPDVSTDGDRNPDIIAPDVAVYFTGDMNLTGTLVNTTATANPETFDESNTAYVDSVDVDANGWDNVYYRWDTHTRQSDNGGTTSWNQDCVLDDDNATNDCDQTPSAWTHAENNSGTYNGSAKVIATNSEPDVKLELPKLGTVKVNMGNQVSVPLTIRPSTDLITGETTKIAGFEFEIRFREDQLTFVDAQTGTLPGPWMTYLNESEPDDEGYTIISFGGLDNSPNNAPQDYYITEDMVALELIFRADSLSSSTEEWTEADLKFVGKANAGNPNGDDLLMERQSGNISIWNEYWAFGGGRPEEDEITYVYPNPYREGSHDSINFQFYMIEEGNVTISIYNTLGQKIKELLNGNVGQGLHNYNFGSLPDALGGDESMFNGYEDLDSGIYLFVLETENRVKSKKFTIIK